MKWINIKKRLPEKGKAVLITDGKNFIVCASLKRWTDEISWDSEGFSGYEWEWMFNNREVTHWAELPKFPKVEE